MLTLNYILLLVESPAASATFYQAILGQAPVEQSPTFALFALPNGMMLGLWSKHTVEPAPTGTGGLCDISFSVDSNEEVDATHSAWVALGAPILQAPTNMDFGRTFLAQDPDGHRLRVHHIAM